MAAPAERLRAAHARHRAGDIEEAYRGYLWVLKRDPGNRQALVLAASIDHGRGDYKTAEGRIAQALRRGADAMLWRQLGEVRRDAGRFLDAAAALDEAIALAPTDRELPLIAASCRLRGQDFDGALAVLEAAEARFGDTLDLRLLRASGLTMAGRHEEANKLHDALAQERPRDARILYNRAVGRRDSGEVEEAIAGFLATLRADPGHGAALLGLGNLARQEGDLATALDCFHRLIVSGQFQREAWSNYLFALTSMEGVAAEMVFDAHRQYGERFDRPRPPAWKLQRDPDKRLRVGYVSGDLRRHPIEHYFMGVLEAHDRTRFEIVLFPTVAEEDEVTARYRALADRWVSLAPLNDTQAADRIVAERIDILVDLAGHTAGNRLPVFGMRPAPVQATWLGYPATTGLRTMDYRIAWFGPESPMSRFHTETPWLIEGGASCYRLSDDLPPPEACARPAPSAGPVLGSFNRIDKMGPELLACWARILAELPDARLVVRAPDLHAQDAATRQHARLTAAGLPGERVEVLPRCARSAYLAAFGDIDLVLDTFPYSGATTSIDTCLMGVPMVTHRGDDRVLGYGAGPLHYLGLERLIADNADSYVALVHKAVGELPELGAGRVERARKFRLPRLHGKARGGLSGDVAARLAGRSLAPRCGGACQQFGSEGVTSAGECGYR